jgi:hypothetical protein
VCSGDGTREERPHGANRNAGVSSEQLPRKRLRDGKDGWLPKRAKRREPTWHRGHLLVATENEVV